MDCKEKLLLLLLLVLLLLLSEHLYGALSLNKIRNALHALCIMIIITERQEFVSVLGELRREEELGTCLQTYG